MKSIDRRSTKEKRQSKKGRKANLDGHSYEDEKLQDCIRAIEEYKCKGHVVLGWKSEKDILWHAGSSGYAIYNIECKEHDKVDWRKAYAQAVSKSRGCTNPVAVCSDKGEPEVMIVPWKLGREMLAAMARIEEELEK